MKYIIGLVILFIYLIYFIFIITNEYFEDLNLEESDITFLIEDQVLKFIESDPDSYNKRFNLLDYKARKITSMQDYTNLYIGSVIIPTSLQIQQIRDSISEVYKLIDLISLKDKIWVDETKFKMLPWKFIIIDSRLIEQGLPHTRYDCIILNQNTINDSRNFIDTLLHEQLHVYQKVYPDNFDKYLLANNFVKHIKYIDTNILYRSNPDTDEWIYSKDGEIYCSKYKLNNPESIKDVEYYPINNCIYEHPREKAVYDLIEKLFI